MQPLCLICVRQGVLLRELMWSQFLMNKGGKGKAIPLQAWTGPEGFRRLRLPDFKTVGT
jgi:hypothetical protein